MAQVLQRRRVANPSGRRASSASRRRLSPAQIAAGFGGKRRQMASKAHRRRTSGTAARRRRPVKKNIGEILTIGLGNPAATKKRKKNMSSKGRSQKTARRRSTSANRTRRAKPTTNPFYFAHKRRTRPRRVNAAKKTSRRYKRNPGFRGSGGVTGMISKASWTVAGLVGARALTQLVYSLMKNPSANSGPLGYISNIAASFALGAAVAKFRSREAGTLVTIGGLAGVVARALAEYTPIGGYVKQQLSGLGDYGLGIYLPTQFNVPLVPTDTQTLAGGAQMIDPFPQPMLTAAGKGVGRLGDVASGVGSRYSTSGRYN